MSRSWGRLYGGTRNHRKIKILAERLPALWTYWYVLIDLAIEVDDNGWIYVSPGVPYTMKELAKELRLYRHTQAIALTEALHSLGMIDLSNKGIFLISFAERNYISDSSTPRVQKYREKQKSEKPDETRVKRFSNVSVTDQNRTEQKQNRTETETPLTPQRGDNGFDEFWKTYPKKIGKGAALKKWQGLKRIGKLPSLETVLAAVESQKTWEQWLKDEGQFIPNPATWLNQNRWEDEQTAGGPQWTRELSKRPSTN